MKRIPICFLFFCLLFTMIVSCNSAQDPAVGSTETETKMIDEETNEPIAVKLEIVNEGKTDYVVVVDYNQKVEKELATALFEAARSEIGIYLKIVDSNKAESSYPHEIAIGKVRDYSAKICESLTGNDFIFCVSGENIVFCATDETMYKYLAATISEIALSRSRKNTWIISSSTNVLYSESRYAEIPYVEFYRAVNHTYGSWYERQLVSLNTAVQADVALCNALNERMQGSAVFMNGKSTALYGGAVVQLDDNDYGKCAQIGVDGTVYIPEAFAEAFFSADLSAGADGTVDLTNYLKSRGDYVLETEAGLVILLPAGEADYSDPSVRVNGYTNAQYLNRMQQFFREFIVPDTDAEHSRVVLEDAGDSYDVKTALDFTTEVRYSCYSPSILAVEENGKTVLYASYEYRPVWDFCEGELYDTYVQKSTDGGLTWTSVTIVKNVCFAELFSLNHTVYLMGNRNGLSCVTRIGADGKIETAELGTKIGVNPTNTLIHNGKLYIATDDFIASIPVDRDPLVASNWTFSESVSAVLTNDWLKKETGMPADTMKWSYMEGNVNLAPDGHLCAIYRLNTTTNFNCHIVVVKFGDDDSSIQSVTIVSCPTTLNKFTIQYDVETGYYIMLTSEYRASPLVTSNERSNVVLLVSKDLLKWEKAANIISDRTMMNSAYQSCKDGWQYIDWEIVGNDIYMLVREADEKGVSYHDGTYTTFYRIENFRDLLKNRI